MAVISMTVGATTPDGATFATQVGGGGPVRVAVSTSADMNSPVFTSAQAVDVDGVAKVSITGLAPGTRYWWQVEDAAVLDTSTTGQFLTHPPIGLPGDFTLGFVADAGLEPDFPGVGAVLAADRLSNAPILDLVRERALADGWLLNCWLGDDSYYDLGSGNHGIAAPATLALYQRARTDRLLQPRHHQLDREVAQTRQKDDHDGAQNNHDSTDPGTRLYNQVFRQFEAHYPLPDSSPDGGVYWSAPIARTLVIGADVRTFKNETPGTMLGAVQLAWMDSLLASTTAKAVLWLIPGQWMGTEADTWASYPDEQAAVIAMFQNRGFLGRVAIIGADAHLAAIDSGGNSPGGIPVLQAASIDATPLGDPEPYNLGANLGREQYGSVRVQDLGSHLVVTLTAWRDVGALFTHQFTILGDPPPTPSSGALVRTLRGSHLPLVEARLLTSFQTGDDPDGDELAILDGGVNLDGTAKIQRSAILATDGRGRWPRRVGDPLLFGNEVFLRRGVDLGGAGPLWVSLGYYRIYRPRQQRAPDGTITLACFDRMSKLIDAKLLAPREFAANRTIRSTFEELVHEVYPAATILFDQNAGMETLGRAVVAERDRYQFLKDIADSLGRIMFWDDQGFLRVEFAPDPGDPVWDVYAGEGGVQLEVNRELDLADLFNAVVAIGDGHDDQDPVRAIAIDANPSSLTFFHPDSQVGERPFFLENPVLNGVEQAATAAFRMLQRNIGMPYKIDFQSIVNPALRPYGAIRVRYDNGDRERHLIETLHIPLGKAASMSGTTKHQTLVQVQV